MGTENLSKFKKAIASEKAAATNKTFSIDEKPSDKFSKASAFLGHDNKDESTKTKLIKNSFLLPEYEYSIIKDTMKMFIDQGIIIKPTEVFRIALTILKKSNKEDICNSYQEMSKISPGKPKK